MDNLDELIEYYGFRGSMSVCVTSAESEKYHSVRDMLIELKKKREIIGFNDYQELAMRTANKECKDIANFGLGLTGEAGEVSDIIKKHLFHGHELNKKDIVNEMGDCLWYLALGCEVIGIKLESIIANNIEKLKKRYPDGFSNEKSINRK